MTEDDHQEVETQEVEEVPQMILVEMETMMEMTTTMTQKIVKVATIVHPPVNHVEIQIVTSATTLLFRNRIPKSNRFRETRKTMECFAQPSAT
jgi:hypothetical protein